MKTSNQFSFIETPDAPQFSVTQTCSEPLFDAEKPKQVPYAELSKQQQTMLDFFRRHPGMWRSAWDFSRGTQILCYTKRISELRRLGYIIEIRWLENVAGGRISEYRLVENP